MFRADLTPAKRRSSAVLFALAVTAALSAAGFGAPPAAAAERETAPPAVQEHVLANGMKVLMVPRHLAPTVAAGWVARVGSANERPGITGISHLFEHMMFKGTRTIGTRDAELDALLIEKQEEIQTQMRAEMAIQRDRLRRGEIADITSPDAKTPRFRELEARFDSLVAQQRDNMVKNEFDQVLSRQGASRINAFTSEDMTFYIMSVPANKLELWFWMESDRLMNPVFREFYSERDVVYEERRLRVESTPLGKFQESFDALFWDASPYTWPVIGYASDLPFITKQDADEYYARYYAPNNVCAVLVGDFDPSQAIDLAERYFGRIPRGEVAPPPMITREPRQNAEKRFYGEAETNPAVTVRWHTVAQVHRDTPALLVLAELLNGPTGRLQRNLVLGQGLATSARAGQDSRKYEGLFEIDAECRDGRAPEELEQAIYAEIAGFQREPVADDELQSVKNRYLTRTWRQLDGNFFQMIRYGSAEALGSWRDADRIDQEVLATTAADVHRVATEYFTRENRAVAIWTRIASAAPEDPALAGLSPQSREMVQRSLARLEGMTGPAQVEEMLDRLSAMGDRMPAEMRPALDLVRTRAEARLAELRKEAQ
ncbi:MAG TPA: pitrilysin family protein [Candidatus Krumholzibacteria bacterium]|nr:pitrilysin family protein [Candidatus Krumholzibacteria bacterium]HPD70145.1 pitrilysin family protein [Candidatus Krumholzibacteria bacterium]HRY40155.1 pitrilysin family protein [Candidatus Krumholzibacteria bacterium]